MSVLDLSLLEGYERELLQRSFYHFIKTVQPDYIFNWHHLQLIDACQRLAERKVKRLIVMMPPRHGKSEVVSRLFPAWALARNPNEQIITASYSADLASAMNRDCQRIICGDTYKSIFPDTRLSEGKEVGVVRNSSRFDVIGKKGHYVSAGVGGGITGVGFTIGIIDDPVKNAAEADSVTYRNSAWEWYTSTFKTRFEPGAVEIVCQTRWHEDDLTGRILQSAKTDPNTEIISFPALCEHPEPNREQGDALWEGKYPRPALLDIQNEVGSRSWNALYQQRPAPDEGGLIKKAWFPEYDPAKVDLKGIAVRFYLDTAYTDQEKNDPCACLAYVKKGHDFYLVGGFSRQLDFNDQIETVEKFCKDYGYTGASVILVEPKATGKSLVQVMKKHTNLNIKEAIAPKESKTARVNSISALVEAGRVHVPKGQVWVLSFLSECASFPNAAHDDQVDCLSGMLINETRKSKMPSFA